jgi:acetate kinase
MAYTPNSGIPMGTRSGDLDAGLAGQVCRIEALDLDGFERMATRESGLLGVSETSADIRDLLEKRASDERASDAIDLFCYQAKKAIGSLATALGGLDAIAFSGGIGENAPAIRGQICNGLGLFGVALDERLNAQSASVISSNDSRVAVHVVKTDEEAVIAEAVRTLLKETP